MIEGLDWAARMGASVFPVAVMLLVGFVAITTLMGRAAGRDLAPAESLRLRLRKLRPIAIGLAAVGIFSYGYLALGIPAIAW